MKPYILCKISQRKINMMRFHLQWNVKKKIKETNKLIDIEIKMIIVQWEARGLSGKGEDIRKYTVAVTK